MKLKKSTIFYTALILSVSNIFLQILGFVYRMFLTDMVGTEGLGIYKITIQIYTVLLAIGTAGVCLVTTNKSAEYMGDSASIKKIVRSSIYIFFMIFLCFSIIVFAFDSEISRFILNDETQTNVLYIILLCIAFTGVENIIKSSLIGIRKVKFTAFSEIFEQILRVLIVLFLIHNYAGGDYRKTAFLIILGMTISEIFSIIFLGTVYEKIHKTDRKSHKKTLVSIAKIAIPVSLASALNNVISSASTIILPKMLLISGFTETKALAELGVISGVLMPILILPIAIISSVSIVIMPTISKNRSRGNLNEVTRKINKSYEACGFIGIGGTILLAYFSKPICEMFYDTTFPTLYVVLLSIAVVFLYYQIVSASILNGLGQERKAIIHSCLGESVQLLITYLLCKNPNINIYGYILGMIASPLIITVLNSFFIFKEYKFRPVKFIIKPILGAIMMFICVRASYLFAINVISSDIYALIFGFICGILSYLLILSAFGINFIRYIKNLYIKESNTNKSFIF